MEKKFPLISFVSGDPDKYALLEHSISSFQQGAEKKVQTFDSDPLFDLTNESSVTEVLNQVSPETNILIIDMSQAGQLKFSKMIQILGYIEDVFKNVNVTFFWGSHQPSQGVQEKIIKLRLSRNSYSFIHRPMNSLVLFMIISNYIKMQNQALKRERELKRLNEERKELYKYFSEDVVQEILSGKGQRSKSASRKSTIMFLDIRNFTGISEKLEPEQVVELLDLLFTDIVDLIFSSKGSVNKFIGDAILATFGCPQSYGNDAENAVKCAVNLIAAVSLFNQVKPSFLQDDISLGIGIATGMVFAGNVGSHRKMEYTVIGDTVNLASRLQDMTKKLSCKLVVDFETYIASGGKIPFKKIDVDSVRGKEKKLDIYHLPDEYFDS